MHIEAPDRDTSARRMRIVHAVRQYPPGVGGVEATVSSLAERQAAQGHRVRVVTLNRIFDGRGGRLASREWRNGVEVVRVPYLGPRKYPLAPGVLRHLRDAEVVHVHGLEFFADCVGLLRFVHRKPLVLSTHGGFFHTSFAQRVKRLWFHTITRTTLRNYAAVAASSVQDAAIFERLAPNKVVTVENAVDTAKFAGLAARGSKTMIYFGRLAPNKGLDRLIPWFASLVETDAQWRLIIAGKEMGVSLDALRALASSCRIAGAVELHPAPTDEQLSQLIRRANVYVGASTFEGFGLAAVEGIGAGLFPLLSDIAPFRRTIERVGCGLTVDFQPGLNLDRFLTALERHEAHAPPASLLPPLRGYDWSTVLDRFATIYAEAIAREQPRPSGRDMGHLALPGSSATHSLNMGERS